jgi:signal transduction histidine kinase
LFSPFFKTSFGDSFMKNSAARSILPGALGHAPGKSWLPVFRRGGLCLGLIFGIIAASITNAPAELLTNAAQVLSLSAERAAQKIPVHVVGIVTAAEPGWGGQFFVQDETSGVFIANHGPFHAEPGDVVEVTGATRPGSYAPVIVSPKCKKLGEAPLPEPRQVPIEQIMSGFEDGQRVEISGIVRAVAPGKTNFDLEIASGGYRLHVFPKTPIAIDPMSLVGGKVRVKGTAAASFNAALRHMVTVSLFVPLPSDIIVEETETLNPFDETPLPLSRIAQYHRDVAPGKRVHLKGVVTLQRPGQDIFLADSTGGLHVRTRQSETLAVGEIVEAVGFPDFDHFLPVLEDAVFRRTREAPQPVTPKRVGIGEIQSGLHHADLVTLRAKVLDRSFRHGRIGHGREFIRTVLMLQHEELVFTAEAETPGRNTALAGIPIGSTIEVTGVCFTESGEDKKLKSLQVLLPSADSFRLLSKPSWLTPRRLLAGLGVLLVVAVVAVAWTVLVSRRNAVLKELIREREKAQTALQQAHDFLEDRVEERTAQLQFQITARKESELQFKAVLSERTRLAQELHDTLEQTLTGIALQLDTASELFAAKPQEANRHLELARDFVGQGQVDVHRSVWDLRSRMLEQFDLPGALRASSEQLMNGAEMRFEVTARGRVRPLPDTLEENLLRIAQEAMTNVIKHAQATAAEIELDYGAKNVLLRIKDNGRGFDRKTITGPDDGHFGLLGMSERAKRLGAHLTIQSQPGGGTVVEIQVALDMQSEPEASVASHT